MCGKNCKCENCNCGGNNWVPCDEPAKETGYMFKGGEKVPIDVPSRGSKVFINTRQSGKTGIKTEIIKNQTKTTVIAIMSRWDFNRYIMRVGVTAEQGKTPEIGFVCILGNLDTRNFYEFRNEPFFIPLINYKNQCIVGKVKGVEREPITFDFNIAHELMARGYCVKCSGDEFGTFYNYGRKEIKFLGENDATSTETGLVDATDIIIETSKDNPYATEDNIKIVKTEIDGFSTKQIRGKWELA